MSWPRKKAGQNRPVIAYAATEHAAIIDSAEAMETQAEIALLRVNSGGHIISVPGGANIGAGSLVAIMQVNNEIGTVQRLSGKEGLISQAHGLGAIFLCDAVQSFGRMPVPTEADLIAVSAHKIHGPKGIGALWVRDGINLAPQQHGGGQEQGLRSGTLSPALCAGFGAAARLAAARMEGDSAHVAALWDRAVELLAGWTINGDPINRYKGNLNIRKDGLDAARLISECRDILFSAGSACASGSGRPSHVLSGIGLTQMQAKSSIRLGFGRYSSMEEIEEAVRTIQKAAERQ